MSFLKSQRHESKKLRDSARGQECKIRIPGVCNFNPETTVLCHLNGAGSGTKHSDLMAAFGCCDCHAAIDRRIKTQYSPNELELMHLQGVTRTQQFWLDNDLVKLT